MRKIKIIKICLLVWIVIFSVFMGYYMYELLLQNQSLTSKYVELNINKPINNIFIKDIEGYLTNKFQWSLIALPILYIFVILALFDFYFLFKNLYKFYMCNECSTGYITYKDYRFFMEYEDSKGNIHKNKYGMYQSLYRKIYKKSNQKIDVFYEKINPKLFIIGNKPSFLMDSFVKPFFLDLFIFTLVFIGIYFLHPFLFLLVI